MISTKSNLIPGSGRAQKKRIASEWTSPLLALALSLSLLALGGVAQTRRAGRNESHSQPALTAAERDLVNQAIGVVCNERKTDPKGSIPIDEMQSRPSLPVRSPEAQEGAERAQRLLPVARSLVIQSLRRLAREYKFQSRYQLRIKQAISRVEGVTSVKPDMDARDNASVFLSHPRTINFGTIFLAGLPSDEGMISVLAHELTHIADGDNELLTALFRAIGNRASDLTGQEIRDQRAEELSCDLVGALAVRSFVTSTPSYEPLPRRIARSLEHNCVDEDEGDDDHLSPRNTIRALLSLNQSLARELISGRYETSLPRR
ncbi:MAG TPA: hypothetical protein VE135_03860 [Pyrinomonadaceae bacterium]|nr:hypothetical protein [Pyrinomonadaceae bacterium]